MAEINYSNLPARLRRIVKNYEYCIEKVHPTAKDFGYLITLKDGYTHRDGSHHYVYENEAVDKDAIIMFFRNIVKSSTDLIQIAMFGFKCPICGRWVSKGMNYSELQGLKVCTYCSINP